MTVDYATADGTAHAPDDYQAGSGTLTFAAGQTTRTVTVPVNGDLLNETDETYFLNLSGPTNATIGDGQGIGTILDDDGVPVAVDRRRDGHRRQLGDGERDLHGHAQRAERPVRQRRLRDRRRHRAGTRRLSSTGGNLVFSPGQTTKTATIQVRGDLSDEPDETFFVNLSGAGQRDDRRRPGRRARSPTTTDRRRCP